ncbi:hypothetical protein Ddye_030146 [Dipteronia dyeriana]|uniref:Uncharacterized protein n=1 Tax=Dipteronia dyeriana TaxID=168575 RepID=A0AAD9WL83_9ROSI|nr:hypothetical protein Ddye_030146 [Dipteronia dyeriana]
MELFVKALASCKKLIGLDFDISSTGLCIVDAAKIEACPILDFENRCRRYFLSTMEKALNRNNYGEGTYEDGCFFLYYLFSPQVLDHRIVTVFAMRDTLNDVVYLSKCSAGKYATQGTANLRTMVEDFVKDLGYYVLTKEKQHHQEWLLEQVLPPQHQQWRQEWLLQE